MNSNSKLYGILPLSETNYQQWKTKMIAMFKRENTWRVITEERPTNADELALWLTRDEKAQGTISLFIEDDQECHIEGKTTAKDMWEALQSHHEKGSGASKYMLVTELFEQKLAENGDLEKHLNKIQMISKNLAALGCKSVAEFGVYIVLYSMPPSYQTLVSSLWAKPEAELTMSNVRVALVGEYRRRKKQTGNDGYDSALKVNKPPRKNMECFFCDGIGHTKAECKKRLEWEKYQNKRRGRRAAAVREQSTLSNSDSDTDGTASVHEAYYANRNKLKANWFLDSGASSHMTNDIRFFSKLNTEYSSSVRVANKDSCSVQGIGEGNVECLTTNGTTKTLCLSKVLYVPDLECGLISVGSLDKQGYHLKIKDNRMIIYKNDKEIAIGDSSSQMYRLRTPEYAFTVMPQHPENCIHKWHDRFAHRDPKAIRRLCNHDLATGITIEDCPIKQICECCVKGKITRQPFPKMSTTTTQNPLELIHTDLCGPMPTATPGGRRYLMTLIDDYSRYTHTFLLTRKSQAGQVIKDFIKFGKTQFGYKPKAFRSDRGGEYLSHDLRDNLQRQGIIFQHTTPYTPEQNGVAERKNRYLVEAVRTMLVDAKLPPTYWGEAVMTATYVQNRLPTRSTTMTPYQLWYDTKPDVKNLKSFGCRALVHIPKQNRNKLNIKADDCVFIGYPKDTKGYRLLEKSSGRIITSRDVRFIESDRAEGEGFDTLVFPGTDTETPVAQPIIIPFEAADELDELQRNVNQGETLSHASSDYVSVKSHQSGDTTDLSSLPASPPSSAPSTPPASPSASAPSTPPAPPPSYDVTPHEFEEAEPRTLEQALKGPHANQWIAAMKEELDSLEQNETWDLEPVPANKKLIGCKWVYKVKANSNGPDRFKARLVAQGFSQKYGVDYDEVFAPVVKTRTIRTLLSVAGKLNYHVVHLDVKTAFLNGKLTKEVIYMQQPPGHIHDTHKDWGCRLNKSIYGLKQAAKTWHDTLDEVLKNHGFKACEKDPCLYKQGTTSVIYLIVHVDDIIVASISKPRIDELKTKLTAEFSINDLGNITCYLGVQIRRNDRGDFVINQSNYIQKILKRAQLNDAKGSTYPMDTGYEKARIKSPEVQTDEYPKLIGSLLYLANNSRPDISAPVNLLSQHVKGTRLIDWNEVRRVCKYLKSTMNYELKLSDRTAKDQDLVGYADANWAEDRETRKSNGGYLFKLNGGTVSWSSKKQGCVTTSSTHAELVALSEASRECVWMRELLDYLDQPQDAPTKIFEDNQSCIKNVHSPGVGDRSKHIETRDFLVRDYEKKGILETLYVPSEDNEADMLTKPLGPRRLKKLTELIGLAAPEDEANHH